MSGPRARNRPEKASALSKALFAALIAACTAGYAQDKAGVSDVVAVTALREPVDKSYRRMIAGMERFEKRRHLAPAASLRFKLLPRHRATDMEGIELEILGDRFAAPVALAPDHTFTLERHPAALKENASVRPNRKAGTMTWRAEIRTPGLPPDTRRLGDLRLECEVGMEAGLISNTRPSLFGRITELIGEGPEYCRRLAPRYLFFADRPLFSVALVSGSRREVLSVDRLYGGASRDPDWKADLPYCDCEVLLDRAYFLPLGDTSWPDDTLVEFEPMEGAQPGALRADEILSAHAANDALTVGKGTKADVRAALGEAVVIDFDSGYEVWVYRERLGEKVPPPPTEVVLLFAPSGTLAKTRIRIPPEGSTR